ncbi:m-phase phosphoprotein 9 [Limosa lapponica baueri]|uniref:M-phase phosphoprotein 9 n=1 Tax=Limosa lapponica baueri TaxID=1758121 RepID=A0A2I0U2F9_LIMLA|nr:m-phase phosphoprotein 9 [Limosa lapponica baueri]
MLILLTSIPILLYSQNFYMVYRDGGKRIQESPSSIPNGVSGYSGNTRSSLTPSSVELLASFMQDIQNIGNADSEIVKNCELIQDEIRQLVKLQTSNWGAGKSRSLPAKLTDTFSSLESQMGMCSEIFEEHEGIVNQLRSNEAESQPHASDLHQECFANDASVTSGYGTLSASQPNPSKSNGINKCTDYMEKTSQGQGRNDILAFSAEFEHKVDEAQCGKKNRIRQNLREKHARHIADLRAYYDSEIQSLKQQLEASHKNASSEDLKKINQNLADRCDQLDAALNEASARIKTLEDKNNMLEKQVADWRERFYAVSDTSKVLQERIEEMRTNNKEKDNTISRLKSRLKDLEEAFEKAYKLSDNKNTRLKEENKMFQNLLGEYESLGKEHERVKDTLNATENKLLDANTQISDLKRTISKLEAQLKQVEHENTLKLRHITESHLRTSCANKLATPDVSRRKWLIPGAEYSIFTGQPLEVQESPKDNRLEETYIPSRHHSPPEKDSSQDDSSTNTIENKENAMSEAPIIQAFKELEEGKAFKDWGTQTEKEDTSTRRQHSGVRHSSCAESVNTGMKKAAARDERSVAQKYEPVLSPCEGDFKYATRITTLAETERLFDELTQEKQQAKIIFIIKLW